MTKQIETRVIKEQQELCTAIVKDVLRSQGSPLAPSVRALMESRFGYDFRRVRLHTDDLAAASVRALGAQAYTVGPHIVFAKGRCSPGTREGMWLLAHELSHVIQQSGSCFTPPLTVTDGRDPLESAADDAADLIVANRRVPPDFAFGAAPAGEIQCHDGPPCPGTTIGAGDRTIWGPANDAIEALYKADPRTGSANALFFGSQFETGRDVLPPSGVPNKKFATMLLKRLRGLVHQRRPDIIDFQKRVFYEIKTVGFAASGNVQKTSYYVIADEVRREYAPNEPPWADYAATWYPPHVIPFPPDPLNRIICTQATDHKLYPGLILYDVRQIPRQRQRRRTAEIRIEAFEPAQAEFQPMVRARLPKAIRYFDPASPDYIIIVPREFFRLDYIQRKADVAWRPLTGKAPFFNQIVTTATVMFVIMGAAQIGIGLGGIIAAAPAFAAAGAGAAVTTGATTTASVGAIEVVVASEVGATAATVGTVATASEIAALAAYESLLASSAAKAAASITAGGVLLLLGNVRRADAATARVDGAIAMHAVPINNFQIVQEKPSASSTVSNDAPTQALDPANPLFGLGREVFYDNSSHWILGKCSVR